MRASLKACPPEYVWAWHPYTGCGLMGKSTGIEFFYPELPMPPVGHGIGGAKFNDAI